MTQIVDLKREDKTRQRAGMVVTGVVVLALVVGALALTTRWIGTDKSAPPAGPSKTARAQQVASGFFAAYDSFDADRMLTYFSDRAVVTGQWNSTEDLRGETGWRQAAGWTELRSPCQASRGGDAVNLRCPYRVQAIGSDQLGRGPFGGAYWSLHVKDGRIIYAHAEFPYNTNGFNIAVWEPFINFVQTQYPDDLDSMYSGDRTTEKRDPVALRLWKQHVADYVASETAG